MNTFSNKIRPLMRFGAAALMVTAVNGCALLRTGSPEKEVARAPELTPEERFTYRCTLGAHRGDSIVHIENTLDAIRAARQNPKYKFIEFDVQYSADKKAIVFHDSNLLRIFGRVASVKETPYEELKRLSENQIPTYEEAVALAAGKPINIEIKSQGNPEDDRQLIDYIVADLKKRKLHNHTLISSISDEAIKYVKLRYPDIPTGQIFWVKASTYLPFDFLTSKLYREIEVSKADYIMLHTVNERNLNDLIRLKPEQKTIVFWDLGDTMYLVHKDQTDRLWVRPEPPTRLAAVENSPDTSSR